MGWMMAAQLSTHMLKHLLIEPAFSAYRKHHSTEAALLRVRSDTLQATDSRKYIMLGYMTSPSQQKVCHARVI